MRTFSCRDKEIIKSVMNQDRNNMLISAKLVKHYFKVKDCALFLNVKENRAFLLGQNEECILKGMSLIVDIISLIEEMEDLGFFYCIPFNSESSLFVSDSYDLEVGNNDSDEFYLSDGTIKVSRKTISYHNKADKLLLSGNEIGEFLSTKVMYYLCCIIYPSTALEELIENKYESLEVKSYKQQVADAKASRNLAWFALFISLLAPFGMTFFNNKYAKTEVINWQFDSLLNEINEISEDVHLVGERWLLENQ